jgi:hypothetical protein
MKGRLLSAVEAVDHIWKINPSWRGRERVVWMWIGIEVEMYVGSGVYDVSVPYLEDEWRCVNVLSILLVELMI